MMLMSINYRLSSMKNTTAPVLHRHDAAVHNDYSKQKKYCMNIYTIRVMQMIDICGM